jgi:predicted CoA-binding protein
MPRPTIAIVGASSNRARYGNRAVRAYAARGYEVFPIHPSEETIEGLRVYHSVLDVPATELDRISLYLPPEVGLRLLDQIARKPARQIWLNPGAESPELIARAEELGLPLVLGCSLIAIGAEPHSA